MTDVLSAARPFEQIDKGLCGYVLREKALPWPTISAATNGCKTWTLTSRRAERPLHDGRPAPVQGEAVGVLCAIRLDDAAPFSDRELGVLNMLAGQASIAIENAHNFEERKRRIIELSILNQTGQALSSTLKMDELIELIYHQVARVMDAQNFYIALYDADRDTIRFRWPMSRAEKGGAGLAALSEEWLPRRGRKGLTEHIIQIGQAAVDSQPGHRATGRVGRGTDRAPLALLAGRAHLVGRKAAGRDRRTEL